MESQNEHISLLVNLLPQYRLLNSLYQQIADNLKLNFDNQCYITDFYSTFKDRIVFEKAVVNLLLSTDKEKLTAIVANLREEIYKNIDIYVNNKDFLEGIDIIKVCSRRYDPLQAEIDGKLKNTNKLWQELTQVRNSLESASWNNDKILTERLTREEEKIDGLYKKEQEKLNVLYQQQKESDNHATKYLENVFGKIYELGCSFISLLNNYFPIEREKEKVPISNPITVSDSTLKAEPIIEQEMIFRTGMFEKLLALEKKLIIDKYLNPELHWISVHNNGKSDIKRLVTFLVGLLDNRYFLPGKDSQIKAFFEIRYYISIGQNFERKRREPLLDDYKVIFYDYHFK